MFLRGLAIVAAAWPLLAASAVSGQERDANLSTAAAHAVLEREMPQIASQIHLRLAAGDYAGKKDGFRITGSAGDIHVQAATTPTLLFGVNWYLKYMAHMNVSPNGSNFGPAGVKLPAVSGTITMPALYPVRYALNENTDGYTTPYWDFTRWQHEIDVMALSGFNAILIQRGNDLAVYRAFRDIGYSDADIRGWITHPAHQNWQWMGNMCCFVEPISLQLMEKRAASARQIIDRLRALGITPVLPGFWGVVPSDFARHVPGSHVVVQTNPWNGFQRPAWLDPRDMAFARLAASFYKHQQELFGESTIYDMETFQEGGQAGNVPIAEGARAIQEALNRAHPDALWFMMAWQDNPKPQLIKAVDRSHIIIADIEQGRIPRDNREADFKGARWLFGGLWEFGGRTTMGAPLYDYAERMPRAAARRDSHLSGLALFTEGLDTNPFAFDLYSEMAWHATPVDLESWTSTYARRRYGIADLHANRAWNILLHTVYSYRADGNREHGERDAAQESLFNAEPSLTATRTGHWAPDVMRYRSDDLKPALTELLQVSPQIRSLLGYQYDLVDLTRQILANESRRLLPLIRAAYESHDISTFNTMTREWMGDMKMEDDVLATNSYFLLGRWFSYVPGWASSAADLRRIEYDAHSILTTWGDRVASGDLHEYANRDWSGLISSYYAPRWQIYFDSLGAALKTGAAPKPIDWYKFGDDWNRSSRSFPAEPQGDPYAASLVVAKALHLAPPADGPARKK